MTSYTAMAIEELLDELTGRLKSAKTEASDDGFGPFARVKAEGRSAAFEEALFLVREYTKGVR